MNNKLFKSKSTEEKRRHLSAVLKNVTGEILDDNMIERILSHVAIDRQYTISVYSGAQAYYEARGQTGPETVLLSIANPKNGHWPSAVVITLNKTDTDKTKNPEIRVCTSNPYIRKEMENAQEL